MPCHKSSQTFFKHDSEFAVLKWPPRSPNLSSIVQLWNVVEQESHIKDVQLVCIQCILQAMLSNTNLPLLLGKPRGAPREQSIYLVPQSLDQSNTSISMKSSAQPDKKKQNNKNRHILSITANKLIQLPKNDYLEVLASAIDSQLN